ncbi:hypothetical protein M3Y95_00317500 [Aphelenchoides besseyi]|nr:hypothetical protein M3Y95_00317500 [Aphelenchoides besseyi]
MSSNLTYQVLNFTTVAEVINESGITIYSTIEHIFLFINTILFGLSWLVISQASTREMGLYRWFLMNETIWSFLFDWIIVQLQPLFLFPGVLCIFVSSSFFRHSNILTAKILLTLFYLIAIGKAHSFAAALMHRFVCAFPNDSSIVRVYKHFTPWIQIAILLGLSSIVFTSMLPFLLSQRHTFIKEQVIAISPIMKKIYEQEETVLCVLGSEKVNEAGRVFVTGIVFMIALIIGFGLLLYYTYHLLNKLRRVIHHAPTLKLQEQLMRACTAQMFGNFVFLFFPLGSLILFQRIGPKHSQLLSTTLYLMLSVNSSFNYVCLLTFIRPYQSRRFSFDLTDNYLYETKLTIGNSKQIYRVLLDLTDTQLWLFGTASTRWQHGSALPIKSSNLTVSNETVASVKFNKSSGIYDFNFRANVLQASSPIVIIDETNIVKNAKFGLVYLGSNSSAAGRLPSKAIGVIGLGRLMNLGSNTTNYMDNMINGTGRIVLCNRPAHKRATLVLNEDYFSQEDINQWGIATMLNSENRIKPTAFEFNLTTIGVGTNYTLSNASITATLTTLSNYVTVDNQTWEIIKKELQLSNVSNSDDVRIDCSRAQPLRLFFGVKQPNGTIGEMMIVGSELIQKISANECKLMVRPFNGTAWIFGGPFLRY